MRWMTMIVAALICTAQESRAAPMSCDGLLQRDQQGYKFGAGGGSLSPSGSIVRKGTTLTFDGVTGIGSRMFLHQAKSPLVFDGQNIGLAPGCVLPSR